MILAALLPVFSNNADKITNICKPRNVIFSASLNLGLRIIGIYFLEKNHCTALIAIYW